MMTKFDLDQFVLQLRSAAREDEPVKTVRALMTEAFADPEAISAAMPDFDNDDEILFEDDSVSIWFVRFVPGLHVPPHDHQTTATIGVYEGAEDNHFYLREDGGLVHKSTRRVGPGDVIALKPDGIHSVEAADGKPSCCFSTASSSWRSTRNGSSSGQIRRISSSPGSSPQDCTVSSRPPARRLRASGCSTCFTLNSALMRARHGCDASTRS